jgi:squalene-associated FAD-dependent desaturase
MGRHVAIVGGGLAGITAALDCAAGGAAVSLLEVRPRLGGAAYSFQRDGLSLDNGQHVFLRCCVAYRALLGRLGSERRVHIQPRLEIPVLKPGAEPVVLRRSSLPAPLHLAAALARYRHIPLSQRAGAARAALALARLQADGEEAQEQTLGQWLAARGQSPATVGALWDLIALPTLNLPADEASLALGAFVFRTGLLSRADAGDIGFHDRPLGETIGEPALRALAQAGVDVRLGWRVARLARTGARFEVHDGSQELGADAVIVALPHARAAALLEALAPPLAQRVGALETSPIINLHVVYDRRVCELPFAAAVGTPVQYVFDRTEAAGAPRGCQCLAVSLSGARREMAMSVDELRERYLPALAQLFPRAREARVERFVVTREHAATFRPTPGAGALRPGPRTPVAGLYLAGAWTDTGWPATLESAVMSGHAAASAALEELSLDSRAAGASAVGVP